MPLDLKGEIDEFAIIVRETSETVSQKWTYQQAEN